MDNMSVLEQALNLLPRTVSVDDKAVKEAVIGHLAQEIYGSISPPHHLTLLRTV